MPETEYILRVPSVCFNEFQITRILHKYEKTNAQLTFQILYITPVEAEGEYSTTIQFRNIFF